MSDISKQLVERLSSHNYDCHLIFGGNLNNLEFGVSIKGRSYRVRPITEAREVIEFGIGLSDWSKDMFCPYAWDDDSKAEPALRELIINHLTGRDLAYLLYEEKSPIGFFFLWGMERNASELLIPELGEGIVDAHQNRGLGGLALDMLTDISEIAGVDAVELTTDPRNVIAKRLYESRGYELLGSIFNPLEIDQTKSIEELSQAERVREEYHMAKIFRNRDNVLDYLTQKRERQNELRKK